MYYNIVMKITIITLFPEMIRGFFKESIIRKAQEKGKVEIELVDLRQFATDDYGTVDDRPYGGGAGMVIRADVVVDALKSIQKTSVKKPRILLTSAKGTTYTQRKAEELASLKHIIIIAGHYEGFDERVMKHIDEEISIGEFVLTGGEIPAAAIVDSIVRLIPGVLKKSEATMEESFFLMAVDDLIEICGEDAVLGLLKKNNINQVQLVEYPHYTRPEEFEGERVPEILKSGNHEEIRKWRIRQAYQQTKEKRPDLLDTKRLQLLY